MSLSYQKYYGHFILFHISVNSLGFKLKDMHLSRIGTYLTSIIKLIYNSHTLLN